MMIPILSTKLYIPLPRPNVVNRTRLIEKLNEGLHHKLTLVSASAGFGKTTLVSEWCASCDRPVAWLSIDEGDNDPARFLTYLVASLQTIMPKIGEGVLGLLQSPQALPIESLLIPLLNEISTISTPFVLVLDDYHLIKASAIDQAISLLIERIPPQMHLVIASREDPHLPIARLRARNQLAEVRVKDLRFTFSESAEFLKQVMCLNLTREDIGLLESRTEGWVAGLQLAALSMLGHTDKASFISSFSGSHHFILDYLLEEVLQQQSATIQTFLLRTSILDRMCGPLCDAVLNSGTGANPNPNPNSSGQEILEYLEHTNLFIVPLDHERKWYRYHHLFADLLRKRLHQNTSSSIGHEKWDVDELHVRASLWYEDNALEMEAFQHAVAAKDIEQATHLIDGNGMPLLFRGAGAVAPVIRWLNSLPREEMNARPSLWVMFASGLLMVGQMSEVEEKLQAAEQSIQDDLEDDKTRDLVGHIAAIRATLAVSKHQSEIIIAESHRALDNLDLRNLPVRTATTWALGYAYQLQRNRTLANEAYSEALSISQRIGHDVITIMATLGSGNLQEADNELYVAAKTYQRVLNMTGDPPMPIACEAYLGLARISYEWNDLKVAKQHVERALQLVKQFDHTDRVVACEIFLARLMLAQGEEDHAAARLVKSEHLARQHQFLDRLPDIAAARVLLLLRLGNLEEAALLAQKYELPISQARVFLAQGSPSAALKVLEPLRREGEIKGWKDECLKVMILQAVALQANDEQSKAIQQLQEVMILAEPGGFIRIFVDEGIPIYKLLSEAATNELMPNYLGKLLEGFEVEKWRRGVKSDHHHQTPSPKSLIEPLSVRELEVLSLIAQGLSNREISERLYLALSTVKGHNQIIFDKLQVSRRTEAIALARKLGLL